MSGQLPANRLRPFAVEVALFGASVLALTHRGPWGLFLEPRAVWGPTSVTRPPALASVLPWAGSKWPLTGNQAWEGWTPLDTVPASSQPVTSLALQWPSLTLENELAPPSRIQGHQEEQGTLGSHLPQWPVTARDSGHSLPWPVGTKLQIPREPPREGRPCQGHGHLAAILESGAGDQQAWGLRVSALAIAPGDRGALGVWLGVAVNIPTPNHHQIPSLQKVVVNPEAPGGGPRGSWGASGRKCCRPPRPQDSPQESPEPGTEDTHCGAERDHCHLQQNRAGHPSSASPSCPSIFSLLAASSCPCIARKEQLPPPVGPATTAVLSSSDGSQGLRGALVPQDLCVCLSSSLGSVPSSSCGLQSWGRLDGRREWA
ncbi:uncharacterized protein LOC125618059 [Marmota marmota marmota]|uniref:uncharacterized protein LOC125618059 n=1 Tax=Marmota marmota marmota TaxID=9994 RepID=UPI002093CB2F|nr:uncharacterized protein LOC125618059 [Marmota marmota marmota]